MTTRMPGMWAKNASGLSEWCSGAWMPPPQGARSTIGQDSRPRVRLRRRAAWQTSWSIAGYMKPSNWISATGRKPLRAEADGETGEQGLGQRRVEHPGGAEAGEQAVGGAEHAAVQADILAQHQDARVLRPSPGRGPFGSPRRG